jgi:hypothetical protein
MTQINMRGLKRILQSFFSFISVSWSLLMVMHIVAANKEDLMNRLGRFVACSVFVALPVFALAQGNSGQMPGAGMMNQEQVQQMNENMARMQALRQEMQNANSPAERQRLREQHMEYMQEHMQMMRGGMMGPGMMGQGMMGNGQGMMGSGQGMRNNQGMMNNQGQGRNQSGNAQGNPSGGPGMDNEQRLEMMEKRMNQMQLMMEQMLENQAQSQRGQ